jgi:hypothetical protein
MKIPLLRLAKLLGVLVVCSIALSQSAAASGSRPFIHQGDGTTLGTQEVCSGSCTPGSICTCDCFGTFTCCSIGCAICCSSAN